MDGENVLVTGANGHIGFALSKALVERGYNVRASVRDKTDPNLVSHLSSLDVEIVELDLMQPETIEAAMNGIEGLFQVAAVYKSWARDPEEEIINPSIIGGINALKAARNANVKKVIFTSSTAAVGRSGPGGRALTEADWNSASKHPYSYAKTEAERRACNLVALLGFFILGMLLAGMAFKMQQGEITGDEEMNERDRQRLESVERRMEGLAEREELLEVSAYDASRAATKLEEHISAFNEVLVRAQEIAAEEKLQELEAAEAAREKEEQQVQLDLEDPDIEMVAERFHDSLGRLVKARDELSKIEEQLAHILKMERDEQLEKLTSMTEDYESTKRKIDALQSTKEARDAAAEESSIMNMLSAAASGAGATDFGGFEDFGDSDEYEVEIYEDEDGSFYYIDPDTGEETPCDEDGNAL